jgi:hypothetical protein
MVVTGLSSLLIFSRVLNINTSHFLKLALSFSMLNSISAEKLLVSKCLWKSLHLSRNTKNSSPLANTFSRWQSSTFHFTFIDSFWIDSSPESTATVRKPQFETFEQPYYLYPFN